jgi:curved DNA-binding protein CbpA
MDHLRALRILGLAPGSTIAEIHGAWRDLAKVWHPDRFAHDERLRQKAGDNLSRINQAYETLHDYDPARSPKIAARVRESVAIILGMGELGEPPPGATAIADDVPAPALVPSEPIGRRRSLRVLGLRRERLTGEVGTRQSSNLPVILAASVVLVVLIAVVYLTR